MIEGFATRIPRLNSSSTLSLSVSAAAAIATASRMFVFPHPFSPMKTLTDVRAS